MPISDGLTLGHTAPGFGAHWDSAYRFPPDVAGGVFLGPEGDPFGLDRCCQIWAEAIKVTSSGLEPRVIDPPWQLVPTGTSVGGVRYSIFFCQRHADSMIVLNWLILGSQWSLRLARSLAATSRAGSPARRGSNWRVMLWPVIRSQMSITSSTDEPDPVPRL